MTEPNRNPAVFLTPADLARRYGVTRSTVTRWTRAQVLPAPLRINDSTPRWRLSTLEAWESEMGSE